MIKNLLLGAIILSLASCKQKIEVDLIVTNANIYTVTDDFSKAEAFAIKDGKFVAVGTSKDILEEYSTANHEDAKGKTIVPGLIDAHCHFYGLGQNQQFVNLVGTASFDEVLKRVSDFQKKNSLTFIRGRGWDQNDWEVKEFPTKEKLDMLFPDIPVILTRVDGHAILVNQKALDMAGVTITTEAIGGEILKTDKGLTGILIDGPMEMVYTIVPETSKTAQKQALLAAQDICFSYGLTTVSDAGLSKEIIDQIEELHLSKALKIRLYAMISNYPENLDYFLNKGIIKTDRLNVRSIKVYGDGALGSRGATLKEEYTDHKGHYGAMVTPVEEIEGLALRIAKTEYQMNTHAIGDSANVVVLRAYKKALTNTTDRRWRVEHAQVIAASDFDYFKSGIIPSVQPTHATSDMYWAKDRLGEDRIKGAYAYKTLLKKAGILALGTDFPVEQVSPFLTFYAAVSRKDVKGYPENGFNTAEALTREETLKGMTIWAAYANFEEKEKGSIEQGKLADFIVLDENIMEVAIEKIPEIKVLKTFVDGEQVYAISLQKE